MSGKYKFYEKFIPKYIPNAVVLAAFSVIAFLTGPVKKAVREAHFEENNRLFAQDENRLLKDARYIENQKEWKAVHFGTHKKSDMSYSGCEIIATYNALRSLKDYSVSMPYLIRHYEQKGIALKGGFGISPSAAIKFFRNRGYDVKKITTRNKGAIDSIGEEYQTFIATFYWNVENIKDQLHTVNISKETDGFYVHNNYCRGEGGAFTCQGAYRSLGDAIYAVGSTAVPIVIICIRPRISL